MRDAAELISEVFDDVVPCIKPGISELELAAKIEYEIKQRGGSGPSFETIVASGPRSAWAHARPYVQATGEKRVGRPRPGCYTPRLLQ